MTFEICGFEDYLRYQKCIHSSSLKDLHEMTIIFSGDQWLRKAMREHDPMRFALGGVPYLETALTTELNALREHSITAIFVFTGIREYHEAWKLYESGRTNSAAHKFAAAQDHSPLASEFVLHMLDILQANSVQAIVSPSSLRQIRVLTHSKRCFGHTVCGESFLALFGIERIILSIDYKSEVCQWFSTADVLSKLRVTQDQFIDACLLSGYSECPRFPQLALQKRKFLFQHAVELVLEHGSGITAITNAHADIQKLMQLDYSSRFFMSRSHITNGPVAWQGCPSSKSYVPSLPSYIIKLISSGVISPMIPSLAYQYSYPSTEPSSSKELTELRTHTQKIIDNAVQRASISMNSIDIETSECSTSRPAEDNIGLDIAELLLDTGLLHGILFHLVDSEGQTFFSESSRSLSRAHRLLTRTLCLAPECASSTHVQRPHSRDLADFITLANEARRALWLTIESHMICEASTRHHASCFHLTSYQRSAMWRPISTSMGAFVHSLLTGTRNAVSAPTAVTAIAVTTVDGEAVTPFPHFEGQLRTQARTFWKQIHAMVLRRGDKQECAAFDDADVLAQTVL